MLEQVLNHLHNWFEVGIHPGTYTILNGNIVLPFLQSGQYYRIVGSIFNDGLYRYGTENEQLQNETFDGAIWALAIPKTVISLSDEISVWLDKYGSVIENPYTSESFGGYSYSKSGSMDDGAGSSSWQAAFRAQLNPWRKLR